MREKRAGGERGAGGEKGAGERTEQEKRREQDAKLGIPCDHWKKHSWTWHCP